MIQDALKTAARSLAEGGVVAFPTETVYGLGANAWDEAAVKTIYRIKGRPDTQPLIVHLARTEDVTAFVAAVPDRARALMEQFWPGPLTIVLPKAPRVPDAVTGGGDTVGVRVPGLEITRQLAAELSGLRGEVCGIAAPSANRTGDPPPADAEAVREGLADRLGEFSVLDGGPCPGKIPSTVVGVSRDGELTVFREGAIPADALRE